MLNGYEFTHVNFQTQQFQAFVAISNNKITEAETAIIIVFVAIISWVQIISKEGSNFMPKRDKYDFSLNLMIGTINDFQIITYTCIIITMEP